MTEVLLQSTVGTQTGAVAIAVGSRSWLRAATP